MGLTLRSDAFTHQGSIPSRYTCEGEDVSPVLQWSGVPPKARSLVLIVDDPDAPDPAAPRVTWVHWVLGNIPGTEAALVEGVQSLPAGTVQGLNDWKREGYGGPCPPIGRHRYVHKLYALDIVLPALQPATRDSLEKAMQGHILARGELVGHYSKKR